MTDGWCILADVAIENGILKIKLSLLDQVLAFPYVSDLAELQLQYSIEATNFGLLKSVGVFANPQGLIFADVGAGDCLVIATRGERFPQIAVQLGAGKDPNAVAHEIMEQLPDSGPVE